ncbi:MAG: UDP-N-acetylmuramoyl-L-alanine--D-glutamate ligase [Lachnospiraceae bacterium]|nr:UDP-N-acetylmuramoyl-L-alanine--D-glutamate ligase [Lachnospiraceae bacterium]
MNFTNCRALVFGAGISGIGAARLLLSSGAAEVILYDGNEKLNPDELKAKVIAPAEPQAAVCRPLRVILGELPADEMDKMDLVVLSPGVPTDLPLVSELRAREIRIWGEVELAWECGQGDVLAITGTNGKTTTTSLLGEIMGNYAKYRKAYSLSAKALADSDQTCAAAEADPDVESSSAAVQAGASLAIGDLPEDRVFVVGNIGNPYTEAAPLMTESSITVAEISSFQLETIEHFAPKVSAILNITPDHLNRHHTMEEYIRVKELITKNQGAQDCCVLNYEDEILREFGKTLQTKVIYFSSLHKLDKGMYLDGENICCCDGETETVLCSVKELNILGLHNYENVMAAAAMAFAYGVPVEVVRKSVCAFQAVEHRIEYVTEKHGVVYYNDSKGTNPDAAIKGIQAMDRPTLLIGGGYDKNSSYEEWIQAFDGKVRYLVLIGQTREKIAEAARKCGFVNCVLADSLEEAVAFCAAHAESGDAVLLSPACASWGMFPNYEVRGRRFKELVNQLD